jgi:hypothetical protein
MFTMNLLSETQFIESVSGESGDQLYLWGTNEKVPPEDGDRMQCPKCCVLNKNRTVDKISRVVIVMYEATLYIYLGV